LDDQVFDVKGLQEYLGKGPDGKFFVSLWTLYTKKEIPCFRIGNRRLFRRAAVDEWIREQEQGAGHQAQEQKPGVLRIVRG
jgi:hypothetical protein